MSKIILFFLSLFCLGTIILIPVGLVGLYYFAKPSGSENSSSIEKYKVVNIDEISPDSLEEWR